MQVSVREDFKTIEMGCHRAGLIQRLDYILDELDRLSLHSDDRLEDEALWKFHWRRLSEGMKDRYGELKRILQEVDQEATEKLNRMPFSFIFLSLLTPMDLHRIPLDFRVCPVSPVSINSHLEQLARFPATHFVHLQSILSFFSHALRAWIQDCHNTA